MKEFENKLTKVSKQQMAVALVEGRKGFYGVYPTKQVVAILLSQWALETGRGRYMHCYNIGNIKASKNYKGNYCYYYCSEIVPTRIANKWKQQYGSLVKVGKRRGRYVEVFLYPKHPATKFRAYKSLADGAVDYIELLAKRFRSAMRYAVKGDVEKFSRELHRIGYYTASVDKYTKTMKALYREMIKEADKLDIPLFTKEEKDKIMDSYQFFIVFK